MREWGQGVPIQTRGQIVILWYSKYLSMYFVVVWNLGTETEHHAVSLQLQGCEIMKDYYCYDWHYSYSLSLDTHLVDRVHATFTEPFFQKSWHNVCKQGASVIIDVNSTKVSPFVQCMIYNFHNDKKLYNMILRKCSQWLRYQSWALCVCYMHRPQTI
jgi:hypothetical protein